ncbi:hypothetical protein BDW02DRAFT_571411 [Decorospora gaudefroyi]|uniref:S-adenosyl-L-methionine-dependent methyltransferase n=1 Tax=Decorospora gaudefroyi TaxID=184978 RepID=A0A6A5K678_9PLEO|nr:hypothetical protein BDW02DRAFT_571411 [Decorospora gaudefroyi]
MASHYLPSMFNALVSVAITIGLHWYHYGPESRQESPVGVTTSQLVQTCLGLVLYQLVRLVTQKWWTSRERESIYGLQHGRLHLHVPTAMWMNMGYWKNDPTPTTKMSEACCNLLKTVLAEAGCSKEMEKPGATNGTRRRKCLIDLGFGCGDQTVYLMSKEPIRSCDKDWWDEEAHAVTFDHYIGITKDAVQARYASERVEELKRCRKQAAPPPPPGIQEQPHPSITLFCADAAKPPSWDPQLQTCIQSARDQSDDCWVLALDTAYHFEPSRWPLVYHVCSSLDASFMAFDLCLSPTATLTEKLFLRILTLLLGAPWPNFVTPQAYREKLMQAGYHADKITIVDISDRVFMPLATFLAAQDRRLKTLGLGIGSLGIARSMFGWWGRSGVVRGVVVVAKK